MPSAWKDYKVAAVAAVVNDKLGLSGSDAWAFAAHVSNGNRHPFITAFLWSLPLLGSSQLNVAGFPMGEPHAYGVVVGDGETVNSINPLTTEWLFHRQAVPSGTCCVVELNRRHALEHSGKWHQKMARAYRPESWLAWAGPTVTLTSMLGLYSFSTTSYYGVLFIGCIYLATLLSNLCLAVQSSHAWPGSNHDMEVDKMLVVAPDDRWVVLAGPRNLINVVTAGSHMAQRHSVLGNLAQYMVVVVILAAGLLEGATTTDAAVLALALALPHIVAYTRARVIGVTPSIRGVSAVPLGTRKYTIRADLIRELSLTAMSDAWAYESGLLSRSYLHPESKA